MPQTPITLQDIIKQRQQEQFVGREEQIMLFERNLNLPLEDGRRKFIFNIFGQGGVGKTSLLHRFRRMIENTRAVSALMDDTQDNVASVMGHISETLERQGYAMKKFSERFRIYRQRIYELESDPELPHGVSSFVGRALAKTGFSLARCTPLGSVLTEFVDEETVAAQMSEWGTYVARKLTNKDEVRLIQEPLEILSPLLLEGFHEIPPDFLLALLFDTYERTSNILDSWLRDLLEGKYGDLPARTILVVAGQQELDKNKWAGYEGLIARTSLEPFTQEEAEEYLSRNGIKDKSTIDVILSLSGRLPLLLATLAAESPTSPNQVGSVSGTATERFLKWVSDPRQRQVALNASLARRLNRDVFGVVANESADTLFTWLKGMPFIQERSDGWSYHRVVRAQMLRHKLHESPQSWAELHGKLAEYYLAHRDSFTTNEIQVLSDAKSHAFTLEVLYHRLCQDPSKGLPIALNGFLDAYAVNREFASDFAETVIEAGNAVEIADLIDWGARLAAVSKSGKEFESKQALEALTLLIKSDVLEDKSLSIALSSRARLHFLLGRNDEALLDLTGAVEVRESAASLSQRGFVLLFVGNIERASADFQRALTLEPETVLAIIGDGFVSFAAGEIEQGLRNFHYAGELEPSFKAVTSYVDIFINAVRSLVNISPSIIDLPDPSEPWSKFAAPLIEFVKTHPNNEHVPDTSTKESPAEWLSQLSPEITQLVTNRTTHQLPVLMGALFGREDKNLQQLFQDRNFINMVTELFKRTTDDPELIGRMLSPTSFLLSKAEGYCRSGQYEEALSAYEQIIAIDPASKERVSTEKGLVLSYLGRYSQAIESYSFVIGKTPDNMANLYNIAVAMARWKGYEVALPYVENARRRIQEVLETEDRGAALYGLGGLEAVSGNHEHALDYLAESMSLESATIKWASRDVAWLDLRSDARFQELLTEHEAETGADPLDRN